MKLKDYSKNVLKTFVLAKNAIFDFFCSFLKVVLNQSSRVNQGNGIPYIRTPKSIVAYFCRISKCHFQLEKMLDTVRESSAGLDMR